MVKSVRGSMDAPSCLLKVKLRQNEKNAIFIFAFIFDGLLDPGLSHLKKHVIFSS